MGITIEALRGMGRDALGNEIDDADAGVDAIYVDEPKRWRARKRVGIVGRSPGAPICLTETLSESQVEQIRKLVESRNGSAGDVKVAPPMEMTKQ